MFQFSSIVDKYLPKRWCYGLEIKVAADTCEILSNGAVFASLYRPKKLFQEFHLPDIGMRECGNADEASSVELKDWMSPCPFGDNTRADVLWNANQKYLVVVFKQERNLDSQRGLTSKPAVLNILTWNRPHKQEATPLKSSGERRCVRPLWNIYLRIVRVRVGDWRMFVCKWIRPDLTGKQLAAPPWCWARVVSFTDVDESIRRVRILSGLLRYPVKQDCNDYFPGHELRS